MVFMVVFYKVDVKWLLVKGLVLLVFVVGNGDEVGWFKNCWVELVV